METKYIAIIAVVVVAIVGVAAFFILNNNDNSDEKLDVDTIKDTIVVGDYTNINVKMTESSEMDHESSLSDFVDELYLPEDVVLSGTEQITYKGKTITCNVYTYGEETYVKYYADQESGFVYREVTDLEVYIEVRSLEDTNLDVSVSKDEQMTKIKASTYIKFSTKSAIEAGGFEIPASGTISIDVTNVTDELVESKVDTDATGNMEVRLKVTAINGNDLTISMNGSEETQEMTKTSFLALIDLDNFKKQLTEQGQKYAEGQKIDLGKKTVFTGERKLTEQSFKISEGKYTEFEATYGDKGVIYSFSSESVQDETAYETTIEISNSSLIQKA